MSSDSSSGSSSNPEAKKVITAGSTVTMHYRLSLEDGTPVDSTFEDGEPLTFTVGDGSLVEGLEYAVMGLQAGEQQSITIGPDVAFGYPDENAVQAMKRSDFAKEMQLKPGLVIQFDAPSGLQVPGTIKEVKDDTVVVDFSHPLAGRTLIFNVQIIDVQ